MFSFPVRVLRSYTLSGSRAVSPWLCSHMICFLVKPLRGAGPWTEDPFPDVLQDFHHVFIGVFYLEIGKERTL